MSFFTQQKSFVDSNRLSRDLENSTQTDSQLFNTQKTANLSQQTEPDWESQISSIFSNSTSKQAVNHSAHLFSQTQSDVDRKNQMELASQRDSQLDFGNFDNSSFASPRCKRRAYETLAGSSTPSWAHKSLHKSQASASSFGIESNENIFGNNYQFQPDQSRSSSRFSDAGVSSELRTPARASNSFMTPFQYQDSQLDIFSTQNDSFKTQKNDPKTQLSSQEYSQPFVQTPVCTLFSQASSSQSSVFDSKRPLSQLSEASTISEPMDDDFDIENIIPSSVRKLHKLVKEKNSDAVFTWIISSQLCLDAFPMHAYSNLKLSLLLSLVSMRDSSVPLQVAAIGRETSHANTIMRSIGKFAERFVTATIPNFEGSSVSRDREISAGPLLLAQKGVLFVGEWSRQQPNALMKLLRIIETGSVTMEKVQQIAPLECAVWCYWSCSNKLKKDASTVNQFISVFGIPTMIDDEPNDNDIVDHLLNSDRERNDTFHIDDDDMSSYLNYAAKQSVTMEPEVIEMLEDYYSAVRVVRPDALTPKAFEVLKQIAESHAKLSLRNQVIAVDALAAINICEKYIRGFFEKDGFFSPPEPQINNVDNIDSYQAQLYNWLETFTKNVLRR